MKKNGRILHLAINEKFIDHAHVSFENVAAGLNDFYIFFDEYTSYIKSTPHQVIRYRDRLSSKLYHNIAAYDFVVVHSLHPFWLSVINACPSHVIFVWVGWGYDYYDLIYSDPKSLLLASTQNLHPTAAIPAAFHLPTAVRSFIEKLILNPDKIAAISRISLFSPVLSNEYDLVKQAFLRHAKYGMTFPQQTEWNYGSLEEVLLKGFLGRRCSGNHILIGNSASASCNHLEILQWLAQHKLYIQDSKVICPLSYGSKSYATAITEAGHQLLQDHFFPLINFMPMTEYLDIVASCSILIMNHKRQQGVGNVLIMLYLGATVFIREESPTYQYLKQYKIVCFSVQQLEAEPELLQLRLTDEERQHNIKCLYQIWSKTALDHKTSNLIEKAKSIDKMIT